MAPVTFGTVTRYWYVFYFLEDAMTTGLGRSHGRTTRARRAAVGATLLALTLSLALAACGSRLDPDTVARTGADTGATGSGGAAADGTVPEGVEAPVPGADPAASAPAGSGSGSAPAGGAGSGGGGQAAAPGGGGTSGSGENAADGGTKAGGCAGFKNQTGITADTITIANASDISGPVPGIFESAQQATRAYVAYFNSTGDICGRKLKVAALDSRADAGADNQAYTTACEKSFAAVGSQSAFDYGGAAAAEKCGLPDVRSYSVSAERTACRTCFAAYAVKPNQVPSAMPQYFKKTAPDAVKSVGMLYVNAGAAPDNAENFRAAWKKNGWNVTVFQGIDTSEFNYAPYVQQLKDKGVKLVNYTGPYQFTVRLQQAMAQQGFEPQIFLQDATIHDQRYVDEAGEYADGVYVYSQTGLFDDFSNKEMELYRAWLAQVDPDAEPNTYGVYAWSAARLFVQQAVALGGRLNRQTLVQSLAKVKDWTGNGIHAPQQVGAETTTNCVSIIRQQGGAWKKVSPGKYLCGPLTDTGLGG
ncbi:ABC-type branched-chain amino acid transport system, substrate-binding protein [Nocardioides lianchengensis]|uniref:ABC-type branched-chain amino acid transport system, substrate-binding protein n=1 Tax=Nocardioides lianchengensis TaxID=1045774 RepID=A0A1G7AQ09_9ACTN|nr:ABC-type branched-chain amino acid transport system, substrate-binding protein [Nocardioides lianchengensis]